MHRRGCLIQKNQTSKAFTDFSSHKLDQDQDQDYEDLLGSNKPLAGPSKALITPKIDITRFTWKNLDQIIELIFQAQTLKGRSSFGDKFKAKSPDIYHDRFHIECYNFCQRYKDYFATTRATGPNWILFVATFLWDQINLHW